MAYTWDADVPEPLYTKTDKDAKNLLKYCLERVRRKPEEPFGFDTETHGKKLPFKIGVKKPLDWMNDTVTFWSLAFRMDDGSYQRWCLQDHHLQMFIPLLENPNAILVTWNGKYDAHVSWNTRVNIWNAQVWDALVMAILYDENYQGRMGLKDCAKRWLGLQMVSYTELFGGVKDNKGRKVKEYDTSIYDLPLDDVVYYASLDAYATLRLYELIRNWLESQPLVPEKTDCGSLWDHFLETEVGITRALWKMERRGMKVNKTYLGEQIPKISDEIEKVEKQINKECGAVVNIHSHPQMTRIFFAPKSEGGIYCLEPVKLSDKTQKPSCDEEVMSHLEYIGNPLAQMVVRGRKLHKVRSTYLQALYNLTDYFDDGRIHPNFNQYGARTGRFSSTTPNSMNFPRPANDEWGIREAFIPKPGYKLIVADYGQLEMRILAHMSQDKRMLEAIRLGKDLHCFTASLMYGTSYEELVEAKKAEDPVPQQNKLKSQRQDAKTIGFGILYGAGPLKISKELGISKKEAKKKIDKYLQGAFPGVASYISKTVAFCRKYGYVRTLSGRRRRLDAAINNSNYSIRGHAEREANNATIQGSAADIVKSAMLYIDECPELDRLQAGMLNQIHDELVLEVPEENAEAAAKLVVHYMENPFGDNNPALCVDLPVDMKIVDNWAQGK